MLVAFFEHKLTTSCNSSNITTTCVYANVSCEPGSSVVIETGYGLDGPGIEPRWGGFSAPVQTCPGAHPVSCTMGTGSFPGVKSSRGVTPTRHPLPVPWSRKGRAIPLFPYGPYGLYRASVPLQGCTLLFFI